MAYQVLYRTYRPTRFSEVIGQDYIVKTLKNAINTNKIAHAYLFAGPRGTGKTSVAKLFARAINCVNFNDEACEECDSCKAYSEGNHPDIIELDAASNNHVDDIREIIEQVPYAPMLGKYKVYIIDEVHMLTTSAFNALLKTLEEPPAHVVFVLATTDPQKVIPTVLSRCQRYNFKKLTIYEIRTRLKDILTNEHIPYEDEAVNEISRLAEGGMRDALSILEQCLSYNPNELKLEDIQNIFGITSTKEEVNLLINTHKNEISEVIEKLRNMYQSGIDTKRLALDLLEIVKETLIYSDRGSDVLLNKINKIEAQEILSLISVEGLLEDTNYLEDVLTKEKQNNNFMAYLELCLIKMSSNVRARKKPVKTVQEVIEEKPVETQKVEEVKQEETVKKTEPVVIEKISEVDLDLMLKILLTATKQDKINDSIIYNRFELYKLEADKRKFYQLLVGTEHFASNKDAIIICGEDKQVANINSKTMNEELYHFLNKELGMYKMVYAITKDEKHKLIDMYRNTTPEQRRIKEVYIEKYQDYKKEKTTEEKLQELFGEIRVED